MKTNPLTFLTWAWLSSTACVPMILADGPSPQPGAPALNRARGGIASASSELSSSRRSEVGASAFDGSSDTKWFNVPDGRDRATPVYQTAWLQYQFGHGERWVVTEYRITSANDAPVRDPMDWELQGSNDGLAWVVLDTRSNQKFERRRTAKTYTVANTVAYAYYRLNITASGRRGDGIQLAELELMAASGASVPTGLTAKAVQSGAALSWEAALGATYYRVRRATTPGGPYGEIAARVERPGYTDTSVKGGGSFHYVVEAVGNAGVSLPSNEASVVVVEVPAGVTATPGRDQVSLRWNPIEGAATYSLRRATDEAGPYALVSANILKPVCTDTALAGGLAYYYTVTATKGGHESVDSPPVKVILPPATPGNLTLSLEKKRLVASWAASPGAASYALKRATSDEGPYRVVASGITETTLTDTDLSSGRTYFYVVSATNAGGDSLASEPASIRVPGLFQR